MVAQWIKNPPANAGDAGDTGSIAGWGRSAGGGHGNPLQCSCLEIPMDRGALWATVHGIAESDMMEVTEQACMHVPEPQEVNGRVINVTE